MHDEEDIDKLKKKNICSNCVEETFLSDKIQEQGNKRKCTYCKNTDKCISIEKLSTYVEEAFDRHYIRTQEPNYWGESEQEGEPVIGAISDAADIPEAAAEDIQKILENKYFDFEMAKIGEETEFSENSYYDEVLPTDEEWQSLWYSFEEILKSESRYFNQEALKALSSIFDGIHTMPTRNGNPLILDAGPDTTCKSFFRARVFQSQEKLLEALKKPEVTLGPPPSHIAIAGRMNAHGISVFYGAMSAEVAIAEVRPPVGSKVAVAEFEIIKPLRLLNLSAFEEVFPQGSIFDPQFAQDLQRATFLRTLCEKITRPVMPNDESLDYLTTQAIADFLATQTIFPIDGILFPSVQVEGDMLNVILFHKGSQVESIEIPEGTEIKVSGFAQDDDGFYPEYSVTEWVNTRKELSNLVDTKPRNLLPTYEFEKIHNYHNNQVSTKPTIRIVIESINVHHVKRAKYKTEIYPVSRNLHFKDPLNKEIF